MHRFIARVLISAGIGMIMVSCGGNPQSSPKALAKAFQRALVESRFSDAAAYVYDDDYTVFFEHWKKIEPRWKGLVKCDVKIEMENKTSGKAMLTGKVKVDKQGRTPSGQRPSSERETLVVKLQNISGEWWIRM